VIIRIFKYEYLRADTFNICFSWNIITKLVLGLHIFFTLSKTRSLVWIHCKVVYSKHFNWFKYVLIRLLSNALVCGAVRRPAADDLRGSVSVDAAAAAAVAAADVAAEHCSSVCFGHRWWAGCPLWGPPRGFHSPWRRQHRFSPTLPWSQPRNTERFRKKN